VAQATPQIDQLVDWLQVSSLTILSSERFRLWRDRLKTSWRWIASLFVLGVLVAWNGSLVLSMGLGLAIVIWVYLAQLGWWRLPKAWNWQKLLSRTNRSLTLAVASGTITACGSYLAIGIWQESRYSWLATGIIIEGLMVLVVLLLMVWQRMGQSLEREGQASNLSLLTDLAATDPLKRLIAVRQLTQQAQSINSALPVKTLPLETAHLADCFRLMLNRETEPIVCSALLDGLHSLNRLTHSASRTQ
jgi:hypothetical protein